LLGFLLGVASGVFFGDLIAPLGVFAITARAAGTLEFHDLQSLEVYLAVYLLFWTITCLWFLPMLVASLTPLSYRDVMVPARDALVPLAFTFPGPGTLLILGFIPFAAWTAGVTITAGQMPAFLGSGMLSLFGHTMVAVPPARAVHMEFSAPYLDQTLAFVVPDHRRSEFSTRASVKSLRHLKVAVPDLPYLRKRVAAYLPNAELVVVDSPRQFFEAYDPSWDALVYSAEAGSVWTLLHPEFSVVIPQPDVVRLPIAFPVARGNEPIRTFLNSWIDLKRRDKTLDRLYDHWILGKTPDSAEPRWCVIRDVLGWVE
jgi:ABC-type amino acid transport substrate-binding protein